MPTTPYIVRSFPGTPGEWVSIPAPVECNRVVIENAHASSPVQLRGADGDTTIKSFRAGEEKPVSLNRIAAGTIVCQFNGTGPIVAEFIL